MPLAHFSAGKMSHSLTSRSVRQALGLARLDFFRRRRAPQIICLSLLLAGGLVPVQAQPDYSKPYYFTTLAGAASIGSSDGVRSAARLHRPEGVAVDVAGNVYAADSGNHTIRKIAVDGTVTTLAGKAGSSGSVDGTGSSARFNEPWGVAVDGAGTVYVADTGNRTIRKITPAGVVTTLAGMAGQPGESADGTGPAARFSNLYGLAVDLSGNLYAGEYGAVRKITSAGVVTTLAGAPGVYGSADGVGSAASFSWITGVAVDGAGNVYVADAWNLKIRKITSAGVVTTVGTGNVALPPHPTGVAVDLLGNIYVTADQGCTIQKISPGGIVSVLAGSIQGSTDGLGGEARFNYPAGVAVDNAGNVLVGDFYNNSIRKITPAGLVSTIAGLAPEQSHGLVDGTGGVARFRRPESLAVDGGGNIHVADRGGTDTLVDPGALRRITPTGIVTSQPLSAPDFYRGPLQGFPPAYPAFYPVALALDAAGNIHVASNSIYSIITGPGPTQGVTNTGNAICKISSAGAVTILAGDPTKFVQQAIVDGIGRAAQFGGIGGLAFDASGTLHVTDMNTIRRITPEGKVTTWVGSPAGYGSADGIGSEARFYSPGSLAFDAAGTLFVADEGNHTIRKVSPAGVVTTLAGTAGQEGSDDGKGPAARFKYLYGLAVDRAGNVYVTDNGTIRKITAEGAVTTLGGAAGIYSSADGVGSAALFYDPHGVALDASGVVYVADTWNNTIRKGQLAGPPTITGQTVAVPAPVGATVEFKVTATAVPAPTYQWYYNGAVFSGANNSTLVINSVRTADAGDYTVVVTNELGSVTSQKATLTVTPPVPEPPFKFSSFGGGGAISLPGLAALALLVLLRPRRF
jgi:sugar lactone lactonase YvrE